jgi:hypothetical protein
MYEQANNSKITAVEAKAMIPNLDQLLIVCGIALAAVAVIVWILVKLPTEDSSNPDDR